MNESLTHEPIKALSYKGVIYVLSHEKYIRRCYDLAVSAGKKGYDTFGAVLVYRDEIIEEAKNTSDYEKGLFGHAEFNLVHKAANKYLD